MNRLKGKFILFFLGLFTAMLFLEITLRVLGNVQLRKIRFNAKQLNSCQNNHYTILCLGDSFTFGIGALEREDYPIRLAGLLNASGKEKKFTVINRGVAGQNTAELLDRLKSNIDVVNPDLIILLIGMNNFWNNRGYREYLKGRTLSPTLYNYLSGLRVYKLIRILALNTKTEIENILLAKELRSNLNILRPFWNEDLIRQNFQSSLADGWIYISQRKYTKAINRFKQGMKINPENSENYSGMGFAYYHQQKYFEAINCYKKALKLNSNDSFAYYGLGWSYRNQHNYSEAIDWFKQGIKVKPEDSKNYCGIGFVYYAQGKYTEAINWFKEGLRVNSCNGGNYYGLGWAYKGQGKYLEAMNCFKKGVRAEPLNNLNYCGIVQLYTLHGIYYDEVLEFLREASKDNPIASNYIGMLKKEKFYKEINDWLKSDVEKIAEICQREKIGIILQNYPRKEGSNEVIKGVAEGYPVPFVDNYRIFEELWNKGENKEDYFVPEGHCNAKGYELMAKSIYKTIMEEKIFSLGD